MDCFEKFDPVSGAVPTWPFYELWHIASEARILIAGMSMPEILGMEYDIDLAIFETKEKWIELGFDDAVERILKEKSWELRYLPEGRPVTAANVRRLLENWPPDADDEPDLPSDDDLSDTEALRIGIYGGTIPRERESEHSYEVRCACVLALMHVANCIATLQCPEEELGQHENGPIAARLVSAANSALTAALALGFAREMAAEIETRSDLTEDFEEAVEEARNRFAAERARKAAMARHGPSKLAIQFVQSEWAKHAEAYGFNKTDFARTYVGLVRNQFTTKGGDPFEVKVETITDIWLSRSASKPAGEPAAG